VRPLGVSRAREDGKCDIVKVFRVEYRLS
jgi:hypothetical protein